jgi:guanine deaminase
MLDPDALMRIAIDQARLGIAAGQTPFGCAIARGGVLLAASHNTVLRDSDITAHAEIKALREACRKVSDVHLEGAIVASTCEPCPMCMAALHWAQVTTVHFGACIADAASVGFNELTVPASELLVRGGSTVRLAGSPLASECRDLFRLWLEQGSPKVY